MQRAVARLRELDLDRARAVEELRAARDDTTELRKENRTLSAGLSEEQRLQRIRRIEGTLREAIAGLRKDASGSKNDRGAPSKRRAARNG